MNFGKRKYITAYTLYEQYRAEWIVKKTRIYSDGMLGWSRMYLRINGFSRDVMTFRSRRMAMGYLKQHVKNLRKVSKSEILKFLEYYRERREEFFILKDKPKKIKNKD